MLSFPDAKEARAKAEQAKTILFSSALKEVEAEIDKAIALGSTAISMCVEDWSTSTQDEVKSFLEDRGYLDVKLYYGSQWDPICDLSFKY